MKGCNSNGQREGRGALDKVQGKGTELPRLSRHTVLPATPQVHQPRNPPKPILLFFTGPSQVTLVKNPPAQCRRCKRHGFDLWVGKIPWERKWQPAPVFLSGEFHEQRSLVGYSPWDHKELDMTERLSTYTHTANVANTITFTLFFSC